MFKTAATTAHPTRKPPPGLATPRRGIIILGAKDYWGVGNFSPSLPSKAAPVAASNCKKCNYFGNARHLIMVGNRRILPSAGERFRARIVSPSLTQGLAAFRVLPPRPFLRGILTPSPNPIWGGLDGRQKSPPHPNPDRSSCAATGQTGACCAAFCQSVQLALSRLAATTYDSTSLTKLDRTV